MTILKVVGLSVSFNTVSGTVKAANDVSFELHENESLALVGETGCGKSVVVNSILQLLPKNAIISGKVMYNGLDLLSADEVSMSRVRGNEISIIFQNPSLSLNPIYDIEHQVSEPLILKGNQSKNSAAIVSEVLLKRLGLGGLGTRYPFQLSGGMNQRAMIACSVALGPRIIIADEPTKGLDRELVRDVLCEIDRERRQNGSSLIIITHDLSVAKSISNRVAVMYCGDLVEIGHTKDVLSNPRHPYSRALLNSLPERGFVPIPGTSPSMIDPPVGCTFHPRCPFKKRICAEKRPPLIPVDGGHLRCWLWD